MGTARYGLGSSGSRRYVTAAPFKGRMNSGRLSMASFRLVACVVLLAWPQGVIMSSFNSLPRFRLTVYGWRCILRAWTSNKCSN